MRHWRTKGTVAQTAVLSAALLAHVNLTSRADLVGPDFTMKDPIIQRAITETIAAQVPGNSPSSCAMSAEVTGGKFAPDFCRFEIVSGGPSCGGNVSCTPDYAINLRTSSPAPNEIISVVLFNIRKFATGTYRYDRNSGIKDFKGQLIDKGAVARRLLKGELTLDRRGDDRVQVSLDVQFAGGITVRASGVIEAKRVSAP